MQTIKRLFFVDDDELFTFITTKTIKETKLIEELKNFGNGLEVFNFLKSNVNNPDVLPDIIFLDLNMPIMDGWQFLEHYEELASEMTKIPKIYILSSSIFPEDIEKSKNLKIVTDYIIKPLTREKLMELFKQI